MFTTSLTAVVVAGLLSTPAMSSQPEWTTNYTTAVQLSAKTMKPIAVFLTTADMDKLTKGAGITPDLAKKLSTDFIPLQVNTTTDDGKNLATAFGITEGVVISDKTGSLIALRHEGAVTGPQLEGYLNKYTAVASIQTTEYQTTVLVNPAAPLPSYTVQPQFVQSQPVQMQSNQQAYSQPQYSQPQFSQQAFSQPQYSQPRPILNAVQNIGQNMGNMVQNFTQNVMSSPLIGGS